MLDGREALSDVEDGMMADDLAELLDSSGLGLLKLRAANPDTVAAKLGGWSYNTLRASRSDLTLWSLWCEGRGGDIRCPDQVDVASWIRALAHGCGDEVLPRAPATIDRYIANVGAAYRLLGAEDPTSGDLVKAERRNMRNCRGSSQRQAKGIRFKGDVSDLDSPATGLSLVALLKACSKDRQGDRDRALLRVAYDTGMRSSELVAIKLGDISERDELGNGTVYIPRSKTDRKGVGREAFLSAASFDAINAWKKSGYIRSGYLFRRVWVHPDGDFLAAGDKPLRATSVGRIYKKLVLRAGKMGLLGEISEKRLIALVNSVSGHSIRVGVAQDNVAAGESVGAIMQAYGWKDSRTVLRYSEKLVAKSSAAARMAQRFK